jgi:hypothetical protein
MLGVLGIEGMLGIVGMLGIDGDIVWGTDGFEIVVVATLDALLTYFIVLETVLDALLTLVALVTLEFPTLEFPTLELDLALTLGGIIAEVDVALKYSEPLNVFTLFWKASIVDEPREEPKKPPLFVCFLDCLPPACLPAGGLVLGLA